MDRSLLEYGLYNWWAPKIRPRPFVPDPYEGLIHPDDEAIAIELNPYQRLLVKVGQEGEYYVFMYGSYRFRAKPSNLWVRKKGDGMLIGDEVNVLSREGLNTPKKGVLCSMVWHYKWQKPVYRLRVDNKLLKKRYFAEDLLLVSA